MKSKLNGKKVTLLIVFFLQLVIIAILLITPVLSVKLNNFVRGQEYYTLTANKKLKPVKYKANDLVEVSGEPNLKDLAVQQKHVVTEEDVNTEIDNELANYSDYTDLQEGMTVESGMNVNIDYDGQIEGKEFDGGSAKSQEVALGSGTLYEDLENAICGHAVGETFKVSIKLPKEVDDFGNKIAAYTVTINSATVHTNYDHDTVTDEFIKNNIQGYNTVEEYKKGMTEEVENYYELEYENNKKSAVLNALKEVSTPVLPEDLYKQELEIYKQQFTNMYCDEDQTLDEYLSAYYDMTEDDFCDDIKEDVDKSIENVVVCQYYADKLGIKLTNEDLNSYIDELSMGTQYSSDRADEIYEMYDSEFMTGKEYISRMALCDKVVESFLKDATFKEYAEEDTADDTEDSAEDSAEGK